MHRPSKPTLDSAKPAWPYPDAAMKIPGAEGRAVTHFGRLWAAGNGQWAKGHGGRRYYFGAVGDPDAALADWRERWPGIVAGAEVPGAGAAPAVRPLVATVGDLLNLWLADGARRLEGGELAPSTALKHRRHARRFARAVGPKTPVAALVESRRYFDAAAKDAVGLAVTTRQDYVVTVRVAFNWAVEAGHMESAPRYGAAFKPAKQVVMRRARHAAAAARPLPDPWTLHRLLDAANPHLLAALLLGVNCGAKAADIDDLGPPMLNLDAGLIDGVRKKTAIPLLAPLWPETVVAIRAVALPGSVTLKAPKGLPWNDSTRRLAREVRVLCQRVSKDGDRVSVQHQHLRHVLRTVGGQVDRDDVRRVMGQQVGDVLDETYDHADYLERVTAVTDSVRAWLRAPVTGRGGRGSVRGGVGRAWRALESEAAWSAAE